MTKHMEVIVSTFRRDAIQRSGFLIERVRSDAVQKAIASRDRWGRGSISPHISPLLWRKRAIQFRRTRRRSQPRGRIIAKVVNNFWSAANTGYGVRYTQSGRKATSNSKDGSTAPLARTESRSIQESV